MTLYVAAGDVNQVLEEIKRANLALHDIALTHRPFTALGGETITFQARGRITVAPAEAEQCNVAYYYTRSS